MSEPMPWEMVLGGARLLPVCADIIWVFDRLLVAHKWVVPHFEIRDDGPMSHRRTQEKANIPANAPHTSQPVL